MRDTVGLLTSIGRDHSSSRVTLPDITERRSGWEAFENDQDMTTQKEE